MKLMIDIAEARFKDIQRIAEVQHDSRHFNTAEQIIAKGIPLEQEPKTETVTEFADRCRECGARYGRLLQQGLNYKSFCKFVAKTIMEEDFVLNAGANAEIFCRKLAELGIVRADGENWVLESEDKDADSD